MRTGPSAPAPGSGQAAPGPGEGAPGALRDRLSRITDTIE